jgi:hypothetical protein
MRTNPEVVSIYTEGLGQHRSSIQSVTKVGSWAAALTALFSAAWLGTLVIQQASAPFPEWRGIEASTTSPGFTSCPSTRRLCLHLSSSSSSFAFTSMRLPNAGFGVSRRSRSA